MKFPAAPGGVVLGTFLIFFMLILMGFCWWIGLSYDRIFRETRECRDLRGEFDASLKKGCADGCTHERSAEMLEAYKAAVDRANRSMSRTLSGRLVARVFNFHTIEKPE